MKPGHRFDFSPRYEPLQHQIEAVYFLLNRDWAALFDEQGLGKTKIVIDTMSHYFSLGTIESAIVICKKSLLATWEKEIAKHTSLKSIVLRGSPKQKGQHYMWFAHFYLLNYDLVSSEVESLKTFLLTRPMALVLDESQRIKNPDGKATQAIHQIGPYAKKRYILTGTPIANSPKDLWAQIYFLDGGQSLGETPGEFFHRFSFQEAPHKEARPDEAGLAKLRKAISEFSIRRVKVDVLELPEKVFETIEVTLETEQRQMYDDLRHQLYLEITTLEGQTEIDESENVLKRLLRLVQIASNPRLFDTSYVPDPAKFVVLDELLKTIVARGEKAIVWTSFVGNIRGLRRRYEKYGTAMLFGEIPLDERSNLVDRFQSSPETRIIVANPAAAREGLTLTAANHAIYLDRSFNLVDYLQSQDRIHRIGQERPSHIYNLIGLDTIDAYIEDVIYRKQVVAQYVYGDTKGLDMPPPAFTRADILRLLGS